MRPHGIVGEIVVEVLSDAPDRFSPGARLLAGDPGGEVGELEILTARPHKGRLIVKLKGVHDRIGAEELRRVLLSIPASAAAPAGPGRYYPHELEGLDVLDEQGARLGRFKAVVENPANDLWVVDTGERDVLVPAVKEIVRDVDLEAGRIILRPVPGLFDR